jgi:hypothetical protein
MNAFDFITRIESAGFTLDLADGNLAISPASQLTDSQRQWIRDHRDELVAALRASESLLDAEGGHDLGVANDADVLPARLMDAATRVCRDHGDDDRAVGQMLDELRKQPGDWDALTDHFESQLPAPPEPGMERVRMQAGFEFDVDLPAEHVHQVRRSVRYLLRDGQGGGSLLGEPGKAVAELVEILLRKYGNRLLTLNDQPAPVTCRGCRHAEIGLRPPVVTCGLGLQATNPAGWLADELHHCGGFEP